jgi:TonB family protein
MFDQLVESEPHSAEFKDRRRYFLVSSIVVGILFSTAVVISIFAANYDLGTGNFELVEMIAPDDLKPTDPEPPETLPQPRNAAPSTSQVATRQVNMLNISEVPTVIPDSVSVTKNTQMERPRDGRFDIGPLNSDPQSTDGSSRDTSTVSGPAGLSTSENVSSRPRAEIDEEVAPPPVIKAQPPKTVSRGVLNGEALSLPKPNYSKLAITANAQGQVTVQVTIDETGRVISANAVGGHPMLRADAERAARAARFSPTKLSDVPVKVTGVITYNFLK